MPHVIDQLRERQHAALSTLLLSVHQPQRDRGDVLVRAGAVQPRPSDAFEQNGEYVASFTGGVTDDILESIVE